MKLYTYFESNLIEIGYLNNADFVLSITQRQPPPIVETDWYESDQCPARDGVYRRMIKGEIVFSYFSAMKGWGLNSVSPEDATYRVHAPSSVQKTPWKGILKY